MNTLRFYRYRLRSWLERIVDRVRKIELRCEGCRRPLIIDELRVEPYAIDNDDVPLCLECASDLDAIRDYEQST